MGPGQRQLCPCSCVSFTATVSPLPAAYTEEGQTHLRSGPFR